MTLQEANKILAIIAETYPLFLKDRNPSITADLWQHLFEEESYEIVEAGLMAYIATDSTGFPPTVGSIKKMISQYIHKTEMDDYEAWNAVLKAASNSIYNSKEEYAKLPRAVQEIVGSPNQLREWAMMNPEEVETVIGSHFRRSYNARKEARKQFDMLPSGLRNTLGSGSESDEPYLAPTRPLLIGEILIGGNGLEDKQ